MLPQEIRGPQRSLHQRLTLHLSARNSPESSPSHDVAFSGRACANLSFHATTVHPLPAPRLKWQNADYGHNVHGHFDRRSKPLPFWKARKITEVAGYATSTVHQ
jgi:hypothetical protein